MLDRAQAVELLKTYTTSEALIRHAYAVEACMRRFAVRYGEDENYWGLVGLLHDVDYDKWPEEHLKVAPELLEKAGFDGAFIRAVLAHGYGVCNEVKPELPVEKVIYTVDELTGLINATALMRPSKSVTDMEVKSVMKKFKEKSFAAGVNRELVRSGCEMLGLTVQEVAGECLEAMRSVHEAIGL